MKTCSRLIILIWLILFGCKKNSYELADMTSRSHFKNVGLPFAIGTQFYLSQGAFGKASHSEKGNEYFWDFNVPYGTKVVAVEAGKVIEIYAPKGSGGCDSKFSNNAHNVKIEASDGTVAQYVHVDAKVSVNQKVKKGDVIAVTALNGFICQPQLHFGIYKSRNDLYTSPTRTTLPLTFEELTDGLAKEGLRFTVK